MRGPPAAGKSFRAKELAVPNGIILSTDEYFYKIIEPEHPNKYSFSANHIKSAHTWNQLRAKELIEKEYPLIIIDNTNTTPSEAKPYVKEALLKNYLIQFEEPTSVWWKENSHLLLNKNLNKEKIKEFAALLFEKSKTTHNVPIQSIEKMLLRWVPNINVELVLNSKDM